MLLGIEHLVRQALLVQQLVDDFGVLDRRGAHQHGLAALVALANILDRGFILLARGLVDAVELVVSLAGPVGWDDHGFEAVDFLELIRFGIGRARHASQLVVQAEVVLECDRSQGLVFSLDVHTFLGLYCLVQAIAPATARHEAAGEFVHDHDFAVLHNVVLIAVIKVVGTQGCVQVVHQSDVGRVVNRSTLGDQAMAGQNTLCRLVPLLGQEDLVRLLINGEVSGLDDPFARARIGFPFLAHQQRNHLVHGNVNCRVVFCLTTDDQWRACLVDQDGVHLVHDGVIQPLLHTVTGFVDHVVTQVIEAVFVVGAVGDVSAIRGLLFLARHVGQVDTHRQTQEVIEAAHPLGIAIGKIVIHGDYVHALARQRIEVHRQRSGQGFALTRAHFRNLAMVQCHAPKHLHIEVAHFHDALGTLTHHSKGFGEDRIKRLALGYAILELLGFGAQRVVRKLLIFGLHAVDASNHFAVLLEKPVISAAENFGEEIGCHANRSARHASTTLSNDRNP